MSKFVRSFVIIICLMTSSQVVAGVPETIWEVFDRLEITDLGTRAELIGLHTRVKPDAREKLAANFQDCQSEDDLRYFMRAAIPGTQEYDDYTARTWCCGLPWFLANMQGRGLEDDAI